MIDLSLCRIEVVKPDHLQRWWVTFVRRGVEVIIAKTKPDFIPEDVYTKVSSQQAAIYLVFYNEQAVGFSIALLQPRMYGDKKDLVVWCGWSLPLRELVLLGIDGKGARELEDFGMRHMEEIAVQCKCDSVYIYSPRPGMKRRSATWGYTVGLVRYDKKVN